MLASPTVNYKAGWSMLHVQAEMIMHLVPHQDITYLVNVSKEDDAASNDEAALRGVLAELDVAGALIDTHVRFVKASHSDVWVRDYGGIFLTKEVGGIEVIDFEFDGYRFIPYAGPATRAVYEHENDLSVRVAAALKLPCRRSPLVVEGGNLVQNGHGTLISVQTSLLQSNPAMTLPEIEAALKTGLGVSKVLWLPKGLATDAHPVLQTPYNFETGGVVRRVYNVGVNHADEMVAWVDQRTVMLPEISQAEAATAAASGDPTVELSRVALNAAFDVLNSSSNAAGEQLKVVRVPDPGSIEIELTPDDVMYQFLADLNANPEHPLVGIEDFQAGRPVRFLLAASYMNFVVSREAVLIPRFFKPGRSEALAQKDEQFAAIVRQYYPGRKVAQIDVDALVVGGGGMHCITQHVA
jgi:agmatine deiminase